MSKAGGVGEILGGAVEADRQAFGQARDAAAGEQQGLPLDLGEAPLPDLRESEEHMGLPDAGEVLAIQQELGPGATIGMAVTEYRRRAGAGGRKRGSRNRRTDDFSRWLLSHGPHPGLFLTRMMARPTELLAAELGCKTVEAANLQVRCADILLPFHEGKKPVEVNVSGKGGMALVLPGMMPGTVDGGVIEAEQLPISLEPPRDDDKQDDKHDAQGGAA